MKTTAIIIAIVVMAFLYWAYKRYELGLSIVQGLTDAVTNGNPTNPLSPHYTITLQPGVPVAGIVSPPTAGVVTNVTSGTALANSNIPRQVGAPLLTGTGVFVPQMN